LIRIMVVCFLLGLHSYAVKLIGILHYIDCMLLFFGCTHKCVKLIERERENFLIMRGERGEKGVAYVDKIRSSCATFK
jgi:hypothetical protein